MLSKIFDSHIYLRIKKKKNPVGKKKPVRDASSIGTAFDHEIFTMFRSTVMCISLSASVCMASTC